ncbi:hypothetical protein EcE24377A_2656 [Escherichia coli O139:H28 str. E24377A]|uniref:Uncharacterized protein n=1 Tax=Escherichia coli O139:H28 (strain E24377A / ETEC) TaxID=331111 RepID=A7ZPH7_ECO24|nr:hypothetical protein EcE24377A_2656 [Escherichia coli O139:H28 str. E24377A]
MANINQLLQIQDVSRTVDAMNTLMESSVIASF